jgi:hypothetical protein
MLRKIWVLALVGILSVASSHAQDEVQENSVSLKFIYSEKATKFCEISTVDFTVTT